MTFTPDGQTLISASRDGNVETLGTRPRGRPRLTFSDNAAEVRAFACSPDGKTLATGGDQDVLCLWDSATGKRLREIDLPGPATNALAFSRDGLLLAAALAPSDQPMPAAASVRVWEVATGKLRADLKCQQTVTALVFAPDGKTLAVALGSPASGETQLWDVNGGGLLTTLHGHQGPVLALAYTLQDGSTATGQCWRQCGSERK